MAQGRTWTAGFNSKSQTDLSLSTPAAAGKLQVMSQSFSQGSMTQGALFRGIGSVGFNRTGFGSTGVGFGMTGGFGTSGSSASRRKEAAAAKVIAEVRALAGDAPIKGDGNNTDLPPKSSHEALLQRLKSRAARLEAEKNRDFLANYRANMYSDEDSTATDTHLDGLLKALDKRTDELKQRSEDLQVEAAEAERRLEMTNSLNLGHKSETELQAMSAFERSQIRVQQDKKEEEFQKQRDEEKALYTKVHRRLQNELIELRDYKVLLREYRRVRLEKLNESLGKVQDGRRLRNCVRVMIRNGAQRILARLETANLPLEPWMREVLVNCCHVEIRIEDAETRLLGLRRQALQPVKTDVQSMLAKTKSERFEDLFRKTWDMRQQRLGITNGTILSEESGSGEPMWGTDTLGKFKFGASDGGRSVGFGGLGSTLGDGLDTPSMAATLKPSATIDFRASKLDASDKVTTQMRAVEDEINALRRLLADMRQNAAAVICNQIRQADKSGPLSNKKAMQWGQVMLSLLVSEDFAKTTMKELQKLAPTAKLTQ
eukprot:TRINITY_DN107807_c0_g1_i1.p1 TRINITY_DN107807_c0_g1~~TRINITY_DN107807_c0_g1_i1.p1  ORF type:complete len:544 (+),score=161.55 TRINITY_DN107807_c0_g1_i1:64-1695(+)